jgi:hypothetical protein
MGSSCDNSVIFRRPLIMRYPRKEDNLTISLLCYKTALITMLKKGIWWGFEQLLMLLKMNCTVIVPDLMEASKIDRDEA